MERLNINIKETQKTPKVEYVEKDKKLIIEGRLIPEDPLIFFTEIENWIGKFHNSRQHNLTIEFYLYYYNTSSLKNMILFFHKLENLNNNLNIFHVLWKCDNGDGDSIEDGKDFKKSLNLDFKIILVEDE